MISGIYQIINTENEKFYIGSSSNLPKRKMEHFGSLQRGKHINRKLQNEFNRYGKDSFIFELLMYCDVDDLLIYEDYFIKELKPELNLQFGVTRREGNWQPSDETRKKMSDSRKKNSGPNKGKKLSFAQKEILKGVNIGNENACKTYYVRLQSPDGELFEEITNLNKFCREHDINSLGTFYQFIHGKKNSYRGWRLL